MIVYALVTEMYELVFKNLTTSTITHNGLHVNKSQTLFSFYEFIQIFQKMIYLHLFTDMEISSQSSKQIQFFDV